MLAYIQNRFRSALVEEIGCKSVMDREKNYLTDILEIIVRRCEA